MNASITGNEKSQSAGLPGSEDQPRKFICHFSFHKNLTVYYGRVAREFASMTGRTQRHFNSLRDEFFAHPDTDLRSVNNHFIRVEDVLAQQPNTALSLFIRDPRDLVVSGYFYHKRGAEKWCNVENPTEETMKIVNLRLPSGYLRENDSIASCLQRLDLEDGLRMEMEMRGPHFETLRAWSGFIPSSDAIAVLRYEDIIKDELAAFSALAAHYAFTGDERRIWMEAAEKYRAKNAENFDHIRNPEPHQWRGHFSSDLLAAFEREYGDVLTALDYR